MTVEDTKKELMVVHQNSPIGKEHEHFFTVLSVDNVIEKLVNRINELKIDGAKKNDAIKLLESVLSSICDAFK